MSMERERAQASDRVRTLVGPREKYFFHGVEIFELWTNRIFN